MLKIAVCDDDRQMLLKMREYLSDFEKLFQIDFYSSGEALLASGESYAFIFLDIDMKGISGIDTARLLRQKDRHVKIIYVTAYDDFKDYAFAVHAFAYLVKPVSRENIRNILHEALEYTETSETVPSVCFQTIDGLLDIRIRDIFYLEYQNRRIRMVTAAGDVWIQDSIHNMSRRMEPWDFLMPHKSFIVNLCHVRNIKGYDILMTDGSIIPLSQKKSADFRKRLASYLASRI